MTAVLSGTNGLLQSYDYQVLTTGFTYTFAAGTQVLVINPAGTLATGTITMPASPADGMTITFSSSQQITALTMAGNGASINNAVTLLPAKTSVTYVYRATGTTWWPTQNVPGVLVNGLQLYRLNASLAGADATGTQSLFGVGVTLASSTVYEFEIVFSLVKTAGTTSHTVSFLIGGTATVSQITYQAFGGNGGNLPDSSTTSAGRFDSNGVSAIVITPAITSASSGVYYTVKGMVSISVGGTFIPQYSLSAAPGGAYSTYQSSFIKIYPVGASGSATNIGSWA